jgi:hypothetical protein
MRTQQICFVTLCFLLVSFVAGCRSAEFYRQARQDDLDQRYPAGSERVEIHEKHGEPRNAVVISETMNGVDVRAQEILKQMDPNTKALLKRYDVYWVFWSYPSHSSFSRRLYADYVFYDGNGQVVSAYRIFVD